ncbi:MAG: hypothetical protein LBL23_00995 [Coriobacteriales bacterium]|jgi:hypothetical protein|nr:hypothetical protein [Coriobacteriales bacterium]
MLANGYYIGSEKNSFKDDKDGREVEYQRVTYVEDVEGAVPLTIPADLELDFTSIARFSYLTLDVRLSKNNNGYIRAKAVGFNPADAPAPFAYNPTDEDLAA